MKIASQKFEAITTMISRTMEIIAVTSSTTGTMATMIASMITMVVTMVTTIVTATTDFKMDSDKASQALLDLRHLKKFSR